jgi:hypothetical protein
MAFAQETWFSKYFGFHEDANPVAKTNYEATKKKIIPTVDTHGDVTFTTSGRSLSAGNFKVLTCAEFRNIYEETKKASVPQNGRLDFSVVHGDVTDLHKDVENKGSFFQAASQFNALEMIDELKTPEHGITNYVLDPTQGPKCAVACPAGTLFRNYFVSIDKNGQLIPDKDKKGEVIKKEQYGQGGESGRQLNMMYHVQQLSGDIFKMQNGYAMVNNKDSLEYLNNNILNTDVMKNRVRDAFQVALHGNVDVDSGGGPTHSVSQIYCSAMPVDYNRLLKPVKDNMTLWQPIATLALESLYESTICIAAIMSIVQSKQIQLYLTLVGGGAFGNDPEWISAAILRALDMYRDCNLKVILVCYEHSSSDKDIGKSILDKWKLQNQTPALKSILKKVTPPSPAPIDARNWFQKYFDFKETTIYKHAPKDNYEHTKQEIKCKKVLHHQHYHNYILTNNSGKSFNAGGFVVSTLGELLSTYEKKRTDSIASNNVIKLDFSFQKGDVAELHRNLANKDSIFQVASQFNALESGFSDQTPNDGITNYENYQSQGAACAMACPAGAMFRNYFVPINENGQLIQDTVSSVNGITFTPGGQNGQGGVEGRQLDMLHKVKEVLPEFSEYVNMNNAHHQFSVEEMDRFSSKFSDATIKKQVLNAFQVAIQYDVDVDMPSDNPSSVTQIYCSAIDVSKGQKALLEPIAKFALESLYQSTLCYAATQSLSRGLTKVYLTLAGLGTYENEPYWIAATIIDALSKFKNSLLQVILVYYDPSELPICKFVLQQWTKLCKDALHNPVILPPEKNISLKNDWFSQYFGFDEVTTVEKDEKNYEKSKENYEKSEKNYEATKKNITCKKVNGTYSLTTVSKPDINAGKFKVNSLSELREQLQSISQSPIKGPKKLTFDFLYEEDIIKKLHMDENNHASIFQAGSNIYALIQDPNKGISPYKSSEVYMNKQGFDCAVACPAGFMFRNYFVSVNANGQLISDPLVERQVQCGQGGEYGTKLNMLFKVEKLLKRLNYRFLVYEDGHAGFKTDEDSHTKLLKLNEDLKSKSTQHAFRDAFNVAIQEDVDVAVKPSSFQIKVTQIYCSALMYNGINTLPLASLALESLYESTILYAAKQSIEKETKIKVYLTLLGYEHYNPGYPDYGIKAIIRALTMYQTYDLDVILVCDNSLFYDDCQKIYDIWKKTTMLLEDPLLKTVSSYVEAKSKHQPAVNETRLSKFLSNGFLREFITKTQK